MRLPRQPTPWRLLIPLLRLGPSDAVCFGPLSLVPLMPLRLALSDAVYFGPPCSWRPPSLWHFECPGASWILSSILCQLIHLKSRYIVARSSWDPFPINYSGRKQSLFTVGIKGRVGSHHFGVRKDCSFMPGKICITFFTCSFPGDVSFLIFFLLIFMIAWGSEEGESVFF